MGKAAARVGDTHTCTKVTPGTPPVPHVGGPVIGPGCLTVLIEKKPAARVGDLCFCVGEPDKIATGSTGVYIGGKPAARMGDRTAHGGKITSGSGTVMIGEGIIPPKVFSLAEKDRLIDEAIKKSIVLLEEKLKLLEQDDPKTLKAFKKWFGRDDEEAKGIILKRMMRALNGCKRMAVTNFEELFDEHERNTCAIIYSEDELYRIKVGNKFWPSGRKGEFLRSGTIVHELSHFADIGGTEDVLYGKKDCLKLAKTDPKGALNNADSFQYFVFA